MCCCHVDVDVLYCMMQGLPSLRQPMQSGAQVHPAGPPAGSRVDRRPTARPLLPGRRRASAPRAPEPAPRPVHAPAARTPPPRVALARRSPPRRRLHPADGGAHVRQLAERRHLHDVPVESDQAAPVPVSVPDVRARLAPA